MKFGCMEGEIKRGYTATSLKRRCRAWQKSHPVSQNGEIVQFSCVRPYLLNMVGLEREITTELHIVKHRFSSILITASDFVLPKCQWIVLHCPVMVTSVEEKMTRASVSGHQACTY